MQVVVIPDHRAAVVTQMLWFKVGAVDDLPGVSGLAHFFEHMMFRGTPKVPGDQYAQTIAKNGGDYNAFTTHDYTAFYEQIAADRLKLAMDLEADRMANLDLSDANVATERDVVMEERRMRVDNNPQALLGEQMAAALHMSHPYGRPVIGWADEIRRIDKLSAQDFYQHHYAPNNATLIIAGDVTPDQVRVLAQAEYGKLPARTNCSRARRIPSEPPASGRDPHDRGAARRQGADVRAAFTACPPMPRRVPQAAEGLETLAQVMGGDETAALYRILVEDKKLASDAGCSYDGYARDAGEFTIFAVPRPGVSLETLERAIDQVIAGFAAAPPKAPADLQRAKTQLVAAVTYRRDSQYALATAYGTALMIGLTADDVNEWPDRIRAVTADGVRDAATRLLRRDAVTAYLEPRGGK